MEEFLSLSDEPQSMELKAEQYAMEVDSKIPNFDPKPLHEAKIRELLRNITSIELKLYSYGCKEFIKLLKGSSGGELLHEYVRMSAKFTELLEVWNRRRGKPGMCYVMSLISVLLSHPEGLYNADDHGRVVISRVLDKFAKLIIEEKLDDVYKEINSKEGKRQKAALVLVAAVVRRGSLLAAEMAKCFDFKNSVLPRLSEYRRKKMDRKMKYSTRGAFIEFAMSFLEVGKPGLLRWVLQRREIFSGILRGLGNDDEETVVYVLSTLRDRVLIRESLVPPGLRSVLFGSVTLEQLVAISAREGDVLAAKIAYEVLLMVCSDPSNGLMPDLKRQPSALKGNPKRLVDLLKKLKATEIDYHQSLLLAVVNGRPALASMYLDQFPYNLDDHTSATWLSAITLAANVLSAVRGGISWDFIHNQGENLLAFEDSDVQSIFKCICFRPFSRLVVNKGLLHSDVLIKHGTLRLLLELLKLLSSFIYALSSKGLSSIKQKVLDETRILLPDPQVLFTLLSSVNSFDQTSESSTKRAAGLGIDCHEAVARKKAKTDIINEDIDIVVGGLDDSVEKDVCRDSEKQSEAVTQFRSDNKNGQAKLMEIWGCYESAFSLDSVEEAEVYFYCKVLESLKIYHGTFRAALEVSYDFLKILPANPLKLPSILLESLLSMLIEHLGCSQESGSSTAMQSSIYKHLQSFLSLLLHSPIQNVRDQAYNLAKAAMKSTGAFDHNQSEIGSWFLFLPVDGQHDSGKYQEGKMFLSLSSPVVSFLCDAVSTVGNNLVKYWDIVKCQDCAGVNIKDVNFSPLVACVLGKCLRLVGSASETFTLPEKSLISLYVCTTLKYLLQTQIDAGVLAAVVHQLLFDRIEKYVSALADVESSCCEWRPIISLYLFSKSILDQETYNHCCTDDISWKEKCSLANTLSEVKKLLSTGSIDVFEVSNALYSTIACANPGDVVDNLPSIFAVSAQLPGFNCLIMNYLCLDQNLMRRVSKLWSDMFYSGLKMCVSTSSQLNLNNDGQPSRMGLHNHLDQEYASIFFGSSLKEAPFYVLFPAIILCGLEHYSEIKDLLVAKVANLGIEHIVFVLRLVLFWSHQIQVSYRKKPSEELINYSELCSLLVECILAQLSSLKVNSASSADRVALPFSVCLQEVAKTVFCHPALTAAISVPFDCPYELTKEFMGNISEGLVRFDGGGICEIERHMLKLLIRTSDYLLALCSKELSMSVHMECKGSIVKVFRNLVQWVFLIFKRRFKMWCGSGDMTILPVLCVVVALMHFVSPIDLLELGNWMLMQLSDSMIHGNSLVNPSSLAFCIACGGFSILFQYLQSSCTKEALSDLFWATKLQQFDATLFESIYFKALSLASCIKADLATCIIIDFADLCLLKALNAAQSLIYRQDCLPISMEINRVIDSTPVRIVSHCLRKTEITRAKFMSILIELSGVHSLVFGQMFSYLLSECALPNLNAIDGICDPSLSEEARLMLLPAAVSYMGFPWAKIREHAYRNTSFIMSSYLKLLFDSFLDWKNFVSNAVFQVVCEDLYSCSVEKLYNFFNHSFLLKAVQLLQWFLISSGDSTKDRRWNLLCSLCPNSVVLDDFLDFDIRDIDSYSVGQLANVINRVVAKISLCFVLLFPEGNKKRPFNAPHDMEGESFVGSYDKDILTMRFLNMLVDIWQQVVKNCPSASHDPNLKAPKILLLGCLEMFTVRVICGLIMKMRSILIKMDSLPFIIRMVKTSLLHRFGDATTLGIVRQIFSYLSDGNLPIILFLQLLLGHSQLASTVGTIDASTSTPSGISLKPISSFLNLWVVPTERTNLETQERFTCRLEVFKILRLLFHLGTTRFGSVSEEDLGVNLRELCVLLLTSYSASASEVDLEIYRLLSEIESAGVMGNKILADHDYLWGSALRDGKVQAIKHVLSKNVMADAEEDDRRSCFRDNFPINSKLVVQTVLYFPFERRTSEKSLFTEDINLDGVQIIQEGHSTRTRSVECYDPVFILSFSFHSLSMGFLDPVEFAGLGLLAIALVSLGSPEEEIRKFAYEVVGRFKDALMSCQRKREVTRLKLLMSFIQNGIDEPWQRIPTILAIYVAEASVILLDPCHDHYAAISRFLMESPRMNLKSIPLFPDICWSSSLNFRTERMWMLRLLYVGIVTEDDAVIYIRNSVLEILLSVYASPLSDTESKELILLVLKKCVEVQKTACYLVENCCLISWLSSILSLYITCTNFDDILSTKQMVILLEVVHETVSSRSTMEWLQKHAIEQLSDLSCQLWNLLVSSKLAPESKLINLLLESILTILKQSHEMNVYRRPLTLSMRSLYQLCEAIDVCGHGKSGDFALYGLKVILLCVPPTNIFDLEFEELCKFLKWAIFTALESDTQQSLRQNFFLNNLYFEGEDALEEYLTSTLLRWLVASVILWRISFSNNGFNPNFSQRNDCGETLLSLVEHLGRKSGERKIPSNCKEILVATIFHLQQLLGIRCRTLPSVVSALTILLLEDESYAAEGNLSGEDAWIHFRKSAPMLWSQIYFPPEANPSWRWSFYEPWADHTTQHSDVEIMDEHHACKKLLIMIRGLLGKTSLHLELLSSQDLESSGIFEWEKTMFLKK